MYNSEGLIEFHRRGHNSLKKLIEHCRQFSEEELAAMTKSTKKKAVKKKAKAKSKKKVAKKKAAKKSTKK